MQSTVGLTADRCETECLHPEAILPLLGRIVAPENAEAVSETFSLLGDTTRVRILHALSLADELCVCDLALLLGISQSALSHQLRLLRTHRVVMRRKEGRVAFYRLSDSHMRHLFAEGMEHAFEEQLPRPPRS
jgi:ArsR family transcriptional regulator, lead/cadmium/zinc/bismuth-responsive transcriptional repressor